MKSMSMSLNMVTIRTPPFCKDRPALWFCSLESQFFINNIKNETTKFHYAVAHLDVECTKEVEDLILNPPKPEPYTRLKEVIISRFSDSYEEKVRRLLEKQQLGDRKPSSFMRHLRSQAGPSFPDKLLLTIWTNQLTRQLQIVLAAQKEQSIEELCELADKLMEINSYASLYPPAVNEVKAGTSSELQSLQRQVQRGDEVQVDLVQEHNDDDVLPDVSLDGYILSITSCTNVTRKTEYKFEETPAEVPKGSARGRSHVSLAVTAHAASLLQEVRWLLAGTRLTSGRSGEASKLERCQ
ncbi:hypothetical protein NE865_06121 [Phthorimaea operculella]|nr:hypothetical protein NE865_06121 [Phthorimaea operculella]